MQNVKCKMLEPILYFYILHFTFEEMEPLQLLLIVTGLAIAAGGVLLGVRSFRRDDTALRPYLPLATVAVGLTIAYRSFADYKLLDGQDIAIMFVFVLALFTLMGAQFFIVDKHKPLPDDRRQTPDDSEPKNDE